MAWVAVNTKVLVPEPIAETTETPVVGLNPGAVALDHLVELPM